MAAELKTKFGEDTEVELVQGDGGVFEVEVEGHLVYSKRQTGRFPQYQEVPNAITLAGIA